MVDFNSVAVSGPTRAYTLDTEGPIDPTIIRSSSQVVNVCKVCGSQTLFHSKAAALANQKRIANTYSEKKFHMVLISIICACVGIFMAVYFSSSCGEGQESVAIFGALGISFGAWVVGMIGINMN